MRTTPLAAALAALALVAGLAACGDGGDDDDDGDATEEAAGDEVATTFCRVWLEPARDKPVDEVLAQADAADAAADDAPEDAAAAIRRFADLVRDVAEGDEDGTVTVNEIAAAGAAMEDASTVGAVVDEYCEGFGLSDAGGAADPTETFCAAWTGDEDGGDQPIADLQVDLELMDRARADAPDDVADAMTLIAGVVRALIAESEDDGVVTQDETVDAVTTTEGAVEATETIGAYCSE